MSAPPTLARGLALAFLAGEWTLNELVRRAMDATGAPRALLTGVARSALESYSVAPVGREDVLTEALAASRAYQKLAAQRPRIHVRHWLLPEPHMATPAAALAQLGLPAIATEAELASFLELPVSQLDWYLDRQLRNRGADANLRHYQYRWVQKRSGAYRLLEAPKPRLKCAQQHVLRAILRFVPAHEACHGHDRKRSVPTFVAPHVGKDVVLRLDLAEFFASVRAKRVRRTFMTLGYPDRIAGCLAALCTTVTPEDVFAAQPNAAFGSEQRDSFLQRQRLRDRHLPQGAPTSSALANLAAYRLDVRLSALARSFGAQYTRYTDDLAFSGDASFRRALDRLLPVIGAIVIEEGFELRYRKTRIMTRSHRQQLCGVVVNDAPALARREYERLEAILVNCVRHGPESQNRDNHPEFQAHLRGRVAWVRQLHPDKGAYLAKLLGAIAFAPSG